MIEVAVTTMSGARVKISIYAEAGYETLWILDGEKRVLQVRSEPTPTTGFANVDLLGDQEMVRIPGIRDRILVSTLLP